MTVVETDGDAFIFDCGIFLPPIVELEEQEKVYSEKRLRSIRAIPNDHSLPSDIRKKVRAIIPSHAHLDHIGAIPYLGYRYKADVIATPFTLEVLKTEYKDELGVVDGSKVDFLAKYGNMPYAKDFLDILETRKLSLQRKSREEMWKHAEKRQEEIENQRQKDQLKYLKGEI